MKRSRRYVNLLDSTREYGGPEEGGWYYDRRTRVAAYKARDNAHAERVAAEWRAVHDPVDAEPYRYDDVRTFVVVRAAKAPIDTGREWYS